ncbi:MAG: hypothetical protein GY896_05470 [Gammaproteobacteria bacterium]|nr:hypothetical protein [Gammaproteobacteria bacterium]
MNDDSIRLYPDWIPIAENEPTRENFEKVNRPEFGYCIVSKTHFSPGEVIACIYSGIIRPTAELHTVQKKHGVHIYDEWFTGLILHSCDPNTYFDQEEEAFVAIKEINSADIVTCDYQATEDFLARSFECKCKTSNCRGQMKRKLKREAD